MIVRRERPTDATVVRAIHVEGFRRGGEEPVEARLLDALRGCDGWIPRFSLVAERDGAVVVHVVCTRAHVGGTPVLGLGPIAVRPDAKAAGAGSAMMHAVIGAADATDEPLIGLLGAPAYYGRFGFVAASQLAIEPPEPSWGAHFQVRTLAAYSPSIRGTFVYAAPFDDID